MKIFMVADHHIMRNCIKGCSNRKVESNWPSGSYHGLNLQSVKYDICRMGRKKLLFCFVSCGVDRFLDDKTLLSKYFSN